MAQWNVSSDQVTIEPRQRRSPQRWLRENSFKLAVAIGLVEAVVAWARGFHLLWLVGLLAVFGYWWARSRVPQPIKRPLWTLAMSQAVAGLVVPAIFAGMAIAIVVGVVLLVIMVLVLLGDRRRT